MFKQSKTKYKKNGVNSMKTYYVSTPSRLCLFGEHQDYLGLEVIATAIDLRFSAKIRKRDDSKVVINIRDEKINALGQTNENGLYQSYTIDLSKPIVYEKKRDYLKSSVNILLKNGYVLNNGFDIKMDSTIPIGKGMCSSSTMIVVLIKAILTAIEHKDANDPEKIATLAFNAEVTEFNEPGGMMDHFTSALGGLVHLQFPNTGTIANRIEANIEGCFILFDSLQDKDTTKVLAASKIPTLEALDTLKPYGVNGIADFLADPNKMELLNKLDEFRAKKLNANINNYKILKEGLALLKSGNIDPIKLGGLIYDHHKNLRDGLEISTTTIEKILETALSAGALGGKVNGSGGGGCLYVYANLKDAPKIMQEVKKIGYPSVLLKTDTGVRLDEIEE